MSAVAKVRSTAAAAFQAAPRLSVAAPARTTAPKAPFMLSVITLISVGLIGLIFFSTVLQRQAFQIAELDTKLTGLANQKQVLQRDLQRKQSPDGLGEAALRLGMVPNTNPVFIRLEDGKIIGKPVAAKSGTNVSRSTQ